MRFYRAASLIYLSLAYIRKARLLSQTIVFPVTKKRGKIAPLFQILNRGLEGYGRAIIG